MKINFNLFLAGDSIVANSKSNKTSLLAGSPFVDPTNSRFIRSYSEEFMSSSEERERGFQFFGGSSAGSPASKHRIVPYFDMDSISKNVTVSEGSAFVHLPCRVKQLGERTVCALLAGIINGLNVFFSV